MRREVEPKAALAEVQRDSTLRRSRIRERRQPGALDVVVRVGFGERAVGGYRAVLLRRGPEEIQGRKPGIRVARRELRFGLDETRLDPCSECNRSIGLVVVI